MTARHAGESRIADQALIDQVRACTEEMKQILWSPLPLTADGLEAERRWRNQWCGRAYALLEQIGEMGE